VLFGFYSCALVLSIVPLSASVLDLQSLRPRCATPKACRCGCCGPQTFSPQYGRLAETRPKNSDKSAMCALMEIPHFLYSILPLLRLLVVVLLWKSLSHIRIPGKYNHRPGIFDIAKECACRPALYSACYLRLKYLQPAV